MSAAKALRQEVLAGIAAGVPQVGPQEVHIDITNGCNARCITCWDHSPLLSTPRTAAWKRQRLPLDAFNALVDDLASMNSVHHVVLSGMGDPLTHPDVYEMIARIKAQGWRLTVLSNLIAADPERLLACPPDNLLVGVHGASPDAYMAFHPGWTESQFFTLCSVLRALVREGVQTRHVQVINRDTAPDVPDMVDLGHALHADRVNYKLASLSGGTETTAITDAQREWLLAEAIPDARVRAQTLGVRTNLDLFEQQVQASVGNALHTTDMASVGCFMGFVYTRIAVDGTVLFCCNTEVVVGHLDQGPPSQLWRGPAWQAVRDRIGKKEFYPGCERCGKYEQNVKWAERVAQHQARP